MGGSPKFDNMTGDFIGIILSLVNSGEIESQAFVNAIDMKEIMRRLRITDLEILKYRGHIILQRCNAVEMAIAFQEHSSEDQTEAVYAAYAYA